MPRAGYATDEQLIAAAAESQTLLELSEKLGRSLSSGSRRQLRLRLEGLGVDTARFTPKGRYQRYTRSMLVEAAGASTSIAGVLRHLDLPLSGGNHAHISRRMAALDIDMSHFRRVASAGQPAQNRRSADEILAAAHRSCQRELVGQPPGEPAVPVPELPRTDGDVLQRQPREPEGRPAW